MSRKLAPSIEPSLFDLAPAVSTCGAVQPRAYVSSVIRALRAMSAGTSRC